MHGTCNVKKVRVTLHFQIIVYCFYVSGKRSLHACHVMSSVRTAYLRSNYISVVTGK
jgi:hypothetical protein